MMENFTMLKMKRKDFDHDDLSDFSLLSSPALKIRRLDAELPPIIEEEGADIQRGYDPLVSENAGSNGMGEQLKPFDTEEELPFVTENEEKAIVLFNPTSNPLLYAPTSYSVDPDLISSFKNEALFGSRLNRARPREEDQHVQNKDNEEANTCRAVIPWVPSQQPDQRPVTLNSQAEVSEAMDAEEIEVEKMEVEDAVTSNVQQASGFINNSMFGDGLQHQWQQQHCMIPQPPQNTTTPIVWYR